MLMQNSFALSAMQIRDGREAFMNDNQIRAELIRVYQSVAGTLDLCRCTDRTVITNDYTYSLLRNILVDYVRMNREKAETVFFEQKNVCQRVMELYDELKSVVTCEHPLYFPESWIRCRPAIGTGDERNYMFYVNRMMDSLFAERFPEYRDLFICRKK